jgi:hypothetical protein
MLYSCDNKPEERVPDIFSIQKSAKKLSKTDKNRNIRK